MLIVTPLPRWVRASKDHKRNEKIWYQTLPKTQIHPQTWIFLPFIALISFSLSKLLTSQALRSWLQPPSPSPPHPPVFETGSQNSLSRKNWPSSSIVAGGDFELTIFLPPSLKGWGYYKCALLCSSGADILSGDLLYHKKQYTTLSSWLFLETGSHGV